MAEATERFFDELGQRGQEPLLRRAKGTLRFDLEPADSGASAGDGVEQWSVTIDHGQVSVRQGNGPADGSARLRKSDFEAILSGELNAMSAALRGRLHLEGDPELFVLFQRVLPGRVATGQEGTS